MILSIGFFFFFSIRHSVVNNILTFPVRDGPSIHARLTDTTMSNGYGFFFLVRFPNVSYSSPPNGRGFSFFFFLISFTNFLEKQ